MFVCLFLGHIFQSQEIIRDDIKLDTTHEYACCCISYLHLDLLFLQPQLGKGWLCCEATGTAIPGLPQGCGRVLEWSQSYPVSMPMLPLPSPSSHMVEMCSFFIPLLSPYPPVPYPPVFPFFRPPPLPPPVVVE